MISKFFGTLFESLKCLYCGSEDCLRIEDSDNEYYCTNCRATFPG